MIKKIIVAVGCFLSILNVSAQKTKAQLKEERRQRISAMIKSEEEGVIAYRKQSAIGVKLINDGYAFTYEFGRAQSIKKMLLFQFELANRIHPREDKYTNPVGGMPFVYGKINNFYVFKMGAQQQFLFGNKSNKNGVSVTGNIGGGITLGLLRPYYIEINDVVNRTRKNIKYEGPDSLDFRNSNTVINLQATGARFNTGWDEIKINPGAYAKAALRFDYGRYNESINAIEVGVTGEFYSKKVAQMVFIDPKQFFFNAYFSMYFGRRK